MSSQGGGKARDKRLHRNKPYERRQGLLGRLTGTVTRLLPEAWVPTWLQEEEEQPEPRPGPATRRNHLNAPVTADTWTAQPSVSTAQLREDEDGRLMADAGGGPAPAPRPAAGPSWARPAAVTEDNTSSPAWPPAAAATPAPARVPAPAPNLDESMARKRRRRQLQREDDSELSDDSGPAPAPAPAAAQAASSTAAAATSRGRPQPGALSSKRPRFNASALSTSLMSQDESANTSLNRSGAGLSPFYPGPTVYGGAANHRRLRVPRAGSGSSGGPYQVRPRVVPARAAEDASLSTTARRILSVLEGMSTPVTDARRVPLSSPGDRLLDCSLDGQRRAGLYGMHGARLGRRRPEDPPVHHVVSPVKVTVEPNRSRSAASAPTEEPAGSRRVTFSSQPAPSSLSAGVPSAATPAGSTGGKMRRQKERGHYSSRPEADPAEMPPSPEPLPDVSLPFMHIKPISLTTSTPKVPAGDVRRPAAPAAVAARAENGAEFTFSSPRVVCPAGAGLVNGLPEGEDEPTFSFSAPTAVGERSAAPVSSGASPAVSSKPEAAERVAFQTPSGGATKAAPAAAKPSPAPVASSWGDKFKPAAGSWSCDVCMVSNKPDATKCVACQTPGGSAAKTDSSAAKLSASAAPAVTDSWGDKFKPAAGQWTCDTCMLSNKAEAATCVACSAPNPSAKSASPASTSSKLSANAQPFTPGSSWSDSAAAAKPAEWSCPTCLVGNKPAVSKCSACGSPRPASREKDSTPYQFGASKPDAGAFSFGFGAKKSGASETTKPAADGFVFGADSSKTAESKTSENKASSGGGFTFGASSSNKPAATAAFSFGFGSGSGAASTESTNAKTSEPAAAKTSESTAKTPALNFGTGSGGSPVSLKRKLPERPAEKPVPELKTGNVMDLLGGSSAKTKPTDANNGSSGETTKSTEKATVLPANGGLSFGAAASSAPAASSATFTFGSSSKTTASGGSTSTATTFNFGESAAKKPTEPAKSEASDVAEKPPALFSFGAKSSGSTEKSGAGFTFGAGSGANVADGPASKDAKTSAAPATSSGFSLGTSKTEQSDKGNAGFTFGASASGSSSQPTAAFTFGSTAKSSDSTEKPASAGFSFGTKASDSSDKPSASFSFGSGSATTQADQPTATFSFGSKTAESTNKPTTAAFSFGSGSAAAKPAGVFTFGSKSASEASTAPAPAAGSFVFGASSSSGSGSSTDKPAAGGFTFGAPATTKSDSTPAFTFGATTNGPAAKKVASEEKPASAAVFQFGSGSTPAAASPFGAAAPAASSAPFAFGAAKSTAPATFNFGSSAAPAATTAPFAFGGAQPAAPAASGVFTFGQSGSQPAATPAFGQSVTPAAQSAGFSFGASATPSFNFSSGQQAAPPAAASGGIFRFGASAAAPTTAAPAAPAFGAAAPTPAAPAFGAAAPAPGGAAANPFSATGPPSIAGRKIRTAKRRSTVKK